MPVVIDEVNAEIVPEPRTESDRAGAEQTAQHDIPAIALRAIEREHYRLHRLSDR
jgi:hypothetical protein